MTEESYGNEEKNYAVDPAMTKKKGYTEKD